jgi:hypothetical protein
MYFLYANFTSLNLTLISLITKTVFTVAQRNIRMAKILELLVLS